MEQIVVQLEVARDRRFKVVENHVRAREPASCRVDREGAAQQRGLAVVCRVNLLACLGSETADRVQRHQRGAPRHTERTAGTKVREVSVDRGRWKLVAEEVEELETHRSVELGDRAAHHLHPRQRLVLDLGLHNREAIAMSAAARLVRGLGLGLHFRSTEDRDHGRGRRRTWRREGRTPRRRKGVQRHARFHGANKRRGGAGQAVEAAAPAVVHELDRQRRVHLVHGRKIENFDKAASEDALLLHGGPVLDKLHGVAEEVLFQALEGHFADVVLLHATVVADELALGADLERVGEKGVELRVLKKDAEAKVAVPLADDVVHPKVDNARLCVLVEARQIRDDLEGVALDLAPVDAGRVLHLLGALAALRRIEELIAGLAVEDTLPHLGGGIVAESHHVAEAERGVLAALVFEEDLLDIVHALQTAGQVIRCRVVSSGHGGDRLSSRWFLAGSPL
mmetsp:Transcript_23932/g.67936  ORF Transcript_23932/g.67936 Transcript_23932/m.67936 type:complete len:453 (+) Transcript_23932:427-1785(+)